MENAKKAPSKRLIAKIVILVFFAVVAIIAAVQFWQLRHFKEEVVVSDALTDVKWFSDYVPSLEGTWLDTPVFFFDSGVEGGTVFICGGPHPYEPASTVAAYLMMENIEVTKGRVIIVPRANYSGSTEGMLGDAYPMFFDVESEWGTSTFRIGDRYTNPLDQWPDPFIFFQYPSGQGLSYEESRNINRAFPGKEDGSLTQRAALAIMKLLEDEGVDYAFDLHEASVTYPVNQTIVTSDGHYDVAYLASLLLQEAGHDMRAEVSAAGNEGYTHRAWNGIEGLSAFLIEVPTPFIDRIPGAITASLVTSGQDDFLHRLAERGLTTIDYPQEGIALSRRVAMHLDTMSTILSVAQAFGGPSAELSWPSGEDIEANGLEAYIHNPEGARTVLSTLM